MKRGDRFTSALQVSRNGILPVTRRQQCRCSRSSLLIPMRQIRDMRITYLHSSAGRHHPRVPLPLRNTRTRLEAAAQLVTLATIEILGNMKDIRSPAV
jgi:hypothetical protein